MDILFELVKHHNKKYKGDKDKAITWRELEWLLEKSIELRDQAQEDEHKRMEEIYNNLDHF